MKKTITIIPFMIVCVIMFAISIIDEDFLYECGYTDRSAIWTHITYMFVHNGLLHLVLNVISFVVTIKFLKKSGINVYACLGISMLSSVLATYMSMHETVTVGASGFIMSMNGYLIGLTLIWRKKGLVNLNKRVFYPYTATLLIYLLLGCFIVGINNGLHLWSFVFGLALSLPFYKYVETKQIYEYENREEKSRRQRRYEARRPKVKRKRLPTRVG